MSMPEFDPWSGAKRRPTCAYRAYCAYPGPNLGTSGTIGTGAELISSASRPDLVRSWEQKLLAARLKLGSAGGTKGPHVKLVISALEFCRRPWVARLTALGWEECDIFAIADDPGERLGLIPFLAGRQIRFATSKAVYLGAEGQLTAYVRACSGAVASSKIWDLPICR